MQPALLRSLVLACLACAVSANSALAGGGCCFPSLFHHCHGHCGQPEQQVIVHVHECEPKQECGKGKHCGRKKAERESAAARESADVNTRRQVYNNIVETVAMPQMMFAPMMFAQPMGVRTVSAESANVSSNNCDSRLDAVERDLKSLSGRVDQFEDKVTQVLERHQALLVEINKKIDRLHPEQAPAANTAVDKPVAPQ